MALFKTQLLFIFLCIVALRFGYTQSVSSTNCFNSQPLCGSSQFSYPNTSGLNIAESGPNYGCLRAQRNPSWFYFQIAEDGDLQFKIEQSTSDGGTPNLDVDFIVFGPFNDFRSPCRSGLTASNTIDCSYNNDFIEFVDLRNTLSGEYYILLITNFSGDPGFIKVTQTAGNATSNCVFLNEPILENLEACNGDTLTLNASTNLAVRYYIWYEDDGSGNFQEISGINTAEYDVSISNTYKAEAYDINNVLIEKFEFNTVFYEVPKVPDSLDDYTLCDTFENNDGIAEFDLSTMDLEILNGLDSSDFLVSYYLSIDDAAMGVKKLPNIYYNKLTKENIYTRIDNITANIASCYSIGKFNIEVNLLPEVKLKDEYILCVHTNGTEEIATPPIIDTELDASQYSFLWYLNGNVLLNETSSTLFPEKDGNYTVEVMEIDTGCSGSATTAVNISSPPMLSVNVTTLAFANTHRIEATATGQGYEDFVFRLDGGPWQESAVFKDVAFGEHEITAKDINGCGLLSKSIMVIDYPHYFTPNGDGVHDTWNIVGISALQNAKIHVFDRYGKLIKQLNPNSSGWNGSFNGVQMETNDYWFTIEYIEPRNGTINIFKAHFTLKR